MGFATSRRRRKRWHNSLCCSRLRQWTVFRRFLVVDVLLPCKSPLHIRTEWDGNHDGELTSEVIGSILKSVAEELKSAGVIVVALVADNAANMHGEKMLNFVGDEVLRLRCAAHTIQLVLQDSLLTKCLWEPKSKSGGSKWKTFLTNFASTLISQRDAKHAGVGCSLPAKKRWSLHKMLSQKKKVFHQCNRRNWKKQESSYALFISPLNWCKGTVLHNLNFLLRGIFVTMLIPTQLLTAQETSFPMSQPSLWHSFCQVRVRTI